MQIFRSIHLKEIYLKLKVISNLLSKTFMKFHCSSSHKRLTEKHIQVYPQIIRIVQLNYLQFIIYNRRRIHYQRLKKLPHLPTKTHSYKKRKYLYRVCKESSKISVFFAMVHSKYNRCNYILANHSGK